MRYIHAQLLVREIMKLGHLILKKQAFGCFQSFWHWLLDQLFPIGPRAYSRLLKYTQQHTAECTENSNWVPHLIRPALLIRQNVYLL